jgi:dihydropteroate synthase
MPSEDFFRLGFDRFNARDYEGWVALWTEDCTWRPATVGGVEGEGGTYRGHAGLRQYLEQAATHFEELRMEPDDFEQMGRVVFATGHAVGRGRQSGADVSQPVAWALEITPDEQVRRGFSSFDFDAARAKAREWQQAAWLPDLAVMGVVNVTPDSFSDGGEFLDPDAAITHGRRLVEEGAHILDIGGESTRPGAEPVPADDELRRVIPVIVGLAGGPAAISIDTTKAEVARRALDAGATIVNDVSAFRFDPELAGLVAGAGCDCCLMHMLGEPRTMQEDPRYEDVVDEVKAFLEERMTFAVDAGIAEERIWLDPGIGFGKTLAHNLELLRRLDEVVALGRPVVVGTSRKSFLGKLTGKAEKERLPGTIATNVLAMERGARVLRVHDVAPVAEALAVAAATLGRA